MKTSDFDYELPSSFIAQHPEDKRENSKLMIVNRDNFDLEHKHFYQLVDYLKKGDVLVLNDTKVIPARIFGHRPGKDEKIEVLLLKNLEGKKYQCLVRPGKKMKIGRKIIFSDQLSGQVVDIVDEGHRVIDLDYEGQLNEILDQIGVMPLPPYIKEKLDDKNKYQTIYARHEGSVAAPTAGLHFTKDLLEKIKQKGVDIAYLTLHVGYGTFKPVDAENIEDHHMHSEFYIVNKKASDQINKAIESGNRVVAVGTTSVRTLESVYQKHGEIIPCAESTDIFIYPGYEFKVVDAMVTNFHLPQSTLIMLVSSFASKDIIMHAYEEAKKHDYRFFSFGDAMLIK